MEYQTKNMLIAICAVAARVHKNAGEVPCATGSLETNNLGGITLVNEAGEMMLITSSEYDGLLTAEGVDGLLAAGIAAAITATFVGD